MRRWELLGEARVREDGELMRLWRRGREFSIRVGAVELMNSLQHDSEDELGALACRKLAGAAAPELLIGGLGMGFTLAATLRALGPAARVRVAELVPAVIEWNRGALGELAGRPLDDARASVVLADVARLLKAGAGAYDAILLDVDNGPEGLTQERNDWLYTEDGLAAAARALRGPGVLAIWSSRPHKAFLARLWKSGFSVTEHPVRARAGRGAHHTIWLAEAK